MKITHVTARCLATLAATAACFSAEAGFEGKTFSTYYGLPNADTPYSGAVPSPSSFSVGAGIETTFNVEGRTFIDVNFSDATLSLVLHTMEGPLTWNPNPFSGLVFNRTGGAPLDFSGWSIDASNTMAGFTAGRVGLTADRLTIDWNGLQYANGTQVVVNFAPVPEPGTYALMALGLVVLAGVARAKRVAAPVALPC